MIYKAPLFGIGKPLPLVGFSEGLKTIKMAVDSYVEVHVEVGMSGVCAVYYVMLDGDNWVPFVEMEIDS
jgi:hypothetical protein